MLEMFLSSIVLLSAKFLPAFSTLPMGIPLKFQKTLLPIPAQVKFAASQARAVVLTGMVVTAHTKEHGLHNQQKY